MKWNALTKVLRYGGWGVLCSCQGVTNTGYQPQGEVSAKAQTAFDKKWCRPMKCSVLPIFRFYNCA